MAMNAFWEQGGSNNDDLIAPANLALTEQQTFSEDLQRSSIYRRLLKVHASQLEAADGDTLRYVLHQHIMDANAAQDRFNQRGKARRFAQKHIQFLTAFSDYVGAYGSIVEIMCAAGGQYGEAAYKMLSTFLIIAVNKGKADEMIANVLEQLRKQYDRFRVLEEIHPTPQMKAYIVEAYKLGIEFARYAIAYYLRSSLGRLWSSLINPPSSFEKKLAPMLQAMEDIKDECSVLNSKRLHKVDEDMQVVQQDVGRIKVDIKDQQTRHWDNLLDVFRDKILPDHQHVAQQASDYEVRLNTTFDSHYQDPSRRLLELKDCQAYRAWSGSQKSCFLLVRGEAKKLTHFCWLSPVFMRFYKELQQADETVAFHSCQVSDMSDQGDRLTLVLSHIAVQILDTLQSALDSKATKSIRRNIANVEWGKDARLALDVVAEILASLERVTLIIDRADLMRGDWEDCISMLSLLASPRFAGGCVVKMILIGSCINKDWGTVKAGLFRVVDESQVLELACAESDWQS